MALELWHNPRCAKSRATLALLEARGLAPRLRLYLQEPPGLAELQDALAKLGRPAAELLRWKEPGLPAGLSPQSPDEVILAALAQDPRLIERPLVICGTQARLGRPPEAVLEIL